MLHHGSAVVSINNTTFTLGSFILLYAALYAAFGVASPFLPAFVEARGIPPEQIGLVFGMGTAIRLLSAPIVGRVADRSGALRLALAVCAAATATVALGYLLAWSFWTIFAISLLYAIAVAPLTNLADALALVASRGGPSQGGQARGGEPLGGQPGRGFEYGWVRGSGSVAFILGSIGAGIAISAHGLPVILILQAALLLAVPIAVIFVPSVARAAEEPAEISRAGIASLIRSPTFRRIVLVAALILGSHAMHDTFAVIRWSAAGIPSETISLLWSISVAGEVLVFFAVGPWLLHRLTPPGAIGLAAVAAAVRWVVEAFTVDIAVLVALQPLHGLTFALLHLACMRVLAGIVPPHLAATAQAIYGTVGVGAATALMTVLSGWLYGRFGALAFLAMSVLCLAALPVAVSLPRGELRKTGPPQ